MTECIQWLMGPTTNILCWDLLYSYHSNVVGITHLREKNKDCDKQRIRAVEICQKSTGFGDSRLTNTSHIRELWRSEDSQCVYSLSALLLWGRAQYELFIAPSTSPPTQTVIRFSSSECLPQASFIFPTTLETGPEEFWIYNSINWLHTQSRVRRAALSAERKYLRSQLSPSDIVTTVWCCLSSALRSVCKRHHYHTLQRDSLAGNADWKILCRQGDISLMSVWSTDLESRFGWSDAA